MRHERFDGIARRVRQRAEHQRIEQRRQPAGRHEQIEQRDRRCDPPGLNARQPSRVRSDLNRLDDERITISATTSCHDQNGSTPEAGIALGGVTVPRDRRFVDRADDAQAQSSSRPGVRSRVPGLRRPSPRRSAVRSLRALTCRPRANSLRPRRIIRLEVDSSDSVKLPLMCSLARRNSSLVDAKRRAPCRTARRSHRCTTARFAGDVPA